jgi:pimeloyl-ACP methyl ester carboxylesterase
VTEVAAKVETARHAAYPGAVAPERRRRVESHGVGVAVVEWGDPDAPPLLLAHGGSDFARTFDVFAPLLAASGFRVVSWDHRGHGDSDPAALYSWEADVRDALAVLESIGDEPIPLVGHSKGGGLLLDLALFFPKRVTRIVSLDGLPSTRRRSRRDLTQEERVQGRAEMLARWLDHRRRAHDVQRRPGTLEELARRRGEMNPRLPFAWLCYLVTAGAREGADGWRWKLDPALRMGGFGPWRPGWVLEQLRTLEVPMLGLVSRIVEPMGWGSNAEELRPYLAPTSVVEDVPDLGHFLHIEAPARIAARVVEFLGAPVPRPVAASARPGGAVVAERQSPRSDRLARAATPDTAATLIPRLVRHGRIELALQRLRGAAGSSPAGSRPLLLLHELGGSAPTAVPPEAAGWPGEVWALDFCGHGRSQVPAGGGYTAEFCMADADVALAALGEATVVGWGLGAYVALLIAGARPSLVKGAVLCDGRGLAGGGPQGGSFLLRPEFADPGPPDPFALAELSNDARPPGYAQLFARQAAHLSGVEAPLAVAARERPVWLREILSSPGVVEEALRAAIDRFRGP